MFTSCEQQGEKNGFFSLHVGKSLNKLANNSTLVSMILDTVIFSKVQQVKNLMKLMKLASHLVRRLAALLCFARVDQPLPQLGGDAGDVEGTGDG